MIIPDNFDTRGSRTESFIQKNYPEFYQFIKDNYNGYPFSEALYRYVFHIDGQVTCKSCGSPVQFISFSHGYPKYCCLECSNNDPDKIKSQVSTLKERHNKKELIEKTNQTLKERYGDNYKNVILEKRKQTCLKKYGVEFPLSSKEIRSKINATISNRTPKEREKIVKKTKATKLKRYGDAGYSNLDLAKTTNIQKYGVEFPFQSDIVQEKGRKTRLEKYGVINPLQNKELNKKARASKKKNYIDNNSDIINRVERDGVEYFKCVCPHCDCDECLEKTFDIPYNKYFVRKYEGREICTKLCPGDSNKGTTIELFVRGVLDRHDVRYKSNYKGVLKNKELDIYIPEHNIAIECNGIYWHSLKDSTYHYNKWKECNEKGIQLITVWEDQILNHPQIIESIILSKLGIYQKRIYARQCKIKEISHYDSVEFLQKNHLQGYVNASVRYGLYYGDELVSIMTFGRKRGALGNHGEQAGWELYRFCNKCGWQIVGAASRLFVHFIKQQHPTAVESFSSNDISNGGVYDKLGFEKKSVVKSSYWYIDRKMNRYHRFHFRKSELVMRGADPDKTEFEIMKDFGYLKIYDSGQTKYIYGLNN